jgi:hypothetical protein
VTRIVEVHKELTDRLKKMLDAQPELQKEEEQWQQRRREQVRHTREAIEVAFNQASEFALVASLTDRELVLTTVPQARCITTCSGRAQADRELVRLAVRQNGHALHDAAAGLTADRKLSPQPCRR